MPCFKPLAAWLSSEPSLSGKNQISFKESFDHQYLPIKLPCGRCIGCKLDRSLSWAIRCVEEAQLKDQNCFITLTYSDQRLPWDGSLVKLHFQKFIKSLRKRYKITIRYYMCGEYGAKLSRPHYHACLFGIDFPDKEIWKETEGILTYTSQTLEELWGRGFCTLGELNFETAAYTARYIAKKITGEKAESHYTVTDPTTGEIIHLEPEYNNMSLKPGIAKTWYEQYQGDVYPSDFLIHCGKTVKIPRYFDKLLEQENPHELEIIKQERKKRAKRFASDNTPERLAVREKIKHIKYKQLLRSYEHDT